MRFALALALASQLIGLIPTGLVLCIEEDGAVCLETQGTLCCERTEGKLECPNDEGSPSRSDAPSFTYSRPTKCGCIDIPLASGSELQSRECQSASRICPRFASQTLAALPPATLVWFSPHPIHVADGEGTGPPGAALALAFVTTVVIRC